MRVAAFDYLLPPELVAQEPPPERLDARLMVVRGGASTGATSTIARLPEHVAEGTLVVVNDTRVLRARILGTKEGSSGKTEIFLVRRVGEDPTRWKALGRASKPIRPGARIVTGGPLSVEVEGRDAEGLLDVKLTTRDDVSLDEALRRGGRIPLPPYIKRDPTAEDEARYQTVFARVDGAVAAPTAGLHLTTTLLDQLRARGNTIAACTLHVGLGTFQPVTVDDLDDHPMHAEVFEVSPALVSAIADARARGAPVLAIGTTVVRALESAADPERPGHVRACQRETRLLVQPGYTFRVVDQLLTNFHLPRSTLLALVCAFGGTERILDAYARAVADRFRFFSYGDAMLIDRADGATR